MCLCVSVCVCVCVQFEALRSKLEATPCKFPTFMRLYDLETYVADKDQMPVLRRLFDACGCVNSGQLAFPAGEATGTIQKSLPGNSLVWPLCFVLLSF